MDKQIFKMILLRLGFINMNYLEHYERDERSENLTGSSLLQSIWSNLGGDVRNNVTLNNLRIFLFAIMGTFIEPLLDRHDQTLGKIDNNEYGYFNEFGDLFLEIDDVHRIQKFYSDLYFIRMQFEALQI